MIAVSTRWKEGLLRGCMVVFAIYAALNVLAMVSYPGGTSLHWDKIGYSFFDNFFSDLGMVRTYAGEPNGLSLMLFASALTLVGIALFIFFVLMASYFTASKVGRISSRIGSAAGILAGLACIGIAATPWDFHLMIHLMFVSILSFGLLVVLVSYSIAIFRSERYPNSYAWAFMAYAGILAIYIVLMMMGLDIETPAGLRMMATSQKIIIYSGMLCLFVQVLGAYRYTLEDASKQNAHSLNEAA